MPRSLGTEFTTALASGEARFFLACEIAYTPGTTSGVVRVWSGVGDIEIGGNTYAGTGALGAIGPVEESSETKSTKISLSLSGIPRDLISATLTANYQGKPCRIYMGLLNDNGQVAGTPFLLAGGRLDLMTIRYGATTATINVSAESPLVSLNNPNDFHYTPEAQKAFWPGDEGLQYVAGLQNKEIVWG